jgi:hypothetical protein
MMIKDHILTDHAKQRMEERNISINDLKDVLECPDISYKGIRGEMNVVKKIGKDKKIRVVYVLKGKEKIIITAIAEAMMGRKEEE